MIDKAVDSRGYDRHWLSDRDAADKVAQWVLENSPGITMREPNQPRASSSATQWKCHVLYAFEPGLPTIKQWGLTWDTIKDIYAGSAFTRRQIGELLGAQYPNTPLPGATDGSLPYRTGWTCLAILKYRLPAALPSAFSVPDESHKA